MLQVCGSCPLRYNPLDTRPKGIRKCGPGAQQHSRAQRCRAGWHSTRVARQQQQHHRLPWQMEVPNMLLPKVAWPARGGKEIIHRANSPRDPGHLDGISTDIGQYTQALAVWDFLSHAIWCNLCCQLLALACVPPNYASHQVDSQLVNKQM